MYNDKGFIKLSRRFFSNFMWNEARTFSWSEAWLDLIQMARFDAQPHCESIGGREVITCRGQYPASTRYLVKRWGWSMRKVRAFVDMLKRKGMVTVEMRNGLSVFTLTNYDKYNDLSEDVSYSLPDDQTRTSSENLTESPSDNHLNDHPDNLPDNQPLAPSDNYSCDLFGGRNASGTNPKKDIKKETNSKELVKKTPQMVRTEGMETFVSEEMREVFTEWLDYKRERHESYKSLRSLRVCYNRLLSLSGGDPEVARQVVERSIAANYKGLFPLKNSAYANSQLNTQSATERIADAQRAATLVLLGDDIADARPDAW